MSKIKSYLFSNFKYNNSNIFTNTNLEVNELINANLENNILKTSINFELILKKYFNETIYNTIITNNGTIINQAKQIIPFEYFDETNKTYCSRIFILSVSNLLYELNLTSYIFELKYTFSTAPTIIFSNNEIYIFDSNDKCVLIDNNKTISIEDLPLITSYETDENYIYFTVANYPFNLYRTAKCSLKNLSKNLSQYEYFQTTIEDGEILKIIKINNKIYAINQFSIKKFDDEFFEINQIDYEIFKDGIICNDDSIYFLTSIGLCVFDGNNLKQLYNFDFISKDAKLIQFHNKLYIFNDNYSNYLFQINIENNSITKINFNGITNIYLIKTHNCFNLCLCQNNNGTYSNYILFNNSYQNSISQNIKFNPIIFGTDSAKLIKNLKFNYSGSFTFKITTDTNSANFSISNQSTINNINLPGYYFKFEIETTSSFSLNSMLISLEEIGE